MSLFLSRFAICFLFILLLPVQSSEDEGDGATKDGRKRAKVSSELHASSDSSPAGGGSSAGAGSSPDSDAEKHFYGLTRGHTDIGSLLESRRLLVDNDERLPQKVRDWHKEKIIDLRKKTEAVRKKVAEGSTFSSSQRSRTNKDFTNLLLFSISFYNDDKIRLALYEDSSFFCSGWPAKTKRENVESVLGIGTNHLSSLIADFDNRYKKGPDEQKKICKEFLKSLDNICPKKDSVSYIHGQRLSYSRDYGREDGEIDLISRIQRNILHTERALLFYLSKDETVEKIATSFPSGTPGPINLYLNIASSRSVCILCSDHLFQEGEWGSAFVKKLQDKKPGCTFKLIITVSSYEPHRDEISGGDFQEHLKGLDSKTCESFGISGGFINFMGSTPKVFDPTKPHIHHIKTNWGRK